jgi:hypothetical protein
MKKRNVIGCIICAIAIAWLSVSFIGPNIKPQANNEAEIAGYRLQMYDSVLDMIQIDDIIQSTADRLDRLKAERAMRVEVMKNIMCMLEKYPDYPKFEELSQDFKASSCRCKEIDIEIKEKKEILSGFEEMFADAKSEAAKADDRINQLRGKTASASAAVFR